LKKVSSINPNSSAQLVWLYNQISTYLGGDEQPELLLIAIAGMNAMPPSNIMMITMCLEEKSGQPVPNPINNIRTAQAPCHA
jgi:hypothetical protein